MIKRLSIIIPAYNERHTIYELIRRVKEIVLGNCQMEIIVVDDGSTDGTQEMLRQLDSIRCFFHEKNRGKGGALKTGILHARGDVILIQDADLEYNPADYPSVLKPIVEGEADFVMGSRFIYEKPKFFTKDGAPFFSHYMGNKIITWMTNLLYAQRNTDYEGGYKAFTRELALSVPVVTDGFAFDNELICKSLRLGYRIVEVPIRYAARLYHEGKKITWRDGIVILWTIIKWRFPPVRRQMGFQAEDRSMDVLSRSERELEETKRRAPS